MRRRLKQSASKLRRPIAKSPRTPKARQGFGGSRLRSNAVSVAIAFLTIPINANAALEARETYALSIAGIVIGEAVLDLSGDVNSYAASIDGDYRFLFWSGAANVESRGVRDGDGFSPRSYRSKLVSSSREVTTSIDFDDTGVTSAKFNSEPPFDSEEFGDRIPVKPDDLAGAADPLSAFLIPASDAISACRNILKVFSGIVRFNVKLIAQAESPKACATEYQPISGHRRVSGEVDRLKSGGLDLSLFEIVPGIWAPHRLGFRTRFGTLALERRAK